MNTLRSQVPTFRGDASDRPRTSLGTPASASTCEARLSRTSRRWLCLEWYHNAGPADAARLVRDAPIPVSREEERGKNDQLICCASCVARVPGADCHVEDASRRFAIVEARRLVATAIWTVTTESPQHDGTRYDDRMIRKGRSRRATRRAMASLAGLAVSRWAPQTCRCRLDVAEQPSRGAAD